MKKNLLNNGLFLSLLTAAILAAAGFGLKTYQNLAVQGKQIDQLERQVEKLGDDLDELAKMVW